MVKSQIHLADWHRILFGDAPASFLFEVFVRSVISYVALLIALRLLGKRMSGQLTVTELAVMLTLGAITSLPMQMPDRGILLGIWVLILALVFQRGLTLLEWRSPRLETITQGKASLIVKDGVLDLAALKAARLSREQVFAVLRQQGLFHLGKVKRLYFEACGEFSVYLENKELPGLSTLPPEDGTARDLQPGADKSVRVCANCGELIETMERDPICPHCGNNILAQAAMNEKAFS